jgi:hypothetical protein
MQLETVFPRDPFWAWLVGMHGGTWTVKRRSQVHTVEGPILLPPIKGSRKIRIDEGKVALQEDDGTLIWLPAGSWAWLSYAHFFLRPPDRNVEFMSEEAAQRWAEERMQIRHNPVCMTPDGPRPFDEVMKEYQERYPREEEPKKESRIIIPTGLV